MGDLKMWNNLNTGEYEGMIAETISIKKENNEFLRVYCSKPLTAGYHPGIVLIPHMPGWDEFTRETARRFTQHGYIVMCPDIYCRVGTGHPEEISKLAREQGGVPDDVVMSDCKASLDYIKAQPVSNGKVGVIGMCSGGRHAFLAACTVDGFEAAVDCWGGGVVCEPEKLTPARPVAPIDYTEKLSIPLLGIFGNLDKSPTPEQVNQLEEELKKYNKNYMFYRYDECGHAFWSYHGTNYRPLETIDSFNKVLQFFDDNLK